MNSDACTTDRLNIEIAREISRPPWLGLSVLLLAGFVTIFDLFVVNVAIPSMQAELGASLSQIGFIVAGYELAFGVLLVTGGRLGEARRPATDVPGPTPRSHGPCLPAAKP